MTDESLLATTPALHIAEIPQSECIFIEYDIDSRHLGIADIQCQFLLFLPIFFLLGLFGLIALEGIQHKLIVGFTILWLVESGLDTIEFCRSYINLTLEESPNIKINRQALYLQHFPVFLIFNIDPKQVGIKCQEIDTDTVNLYFCLKTFCQHFGRIVQHLLLDRAGVEDKCSTQQDDHKDGG